MRHRRALAAADENTSALSRELDRRHDRPWAAGGAIDHHIRHGAAGDVSEGLEQVLRFFGELFDGRVGTTDLVVWGAILLGVTSGVLGCFIVLRRQSLLAPVTVWVRALIRSASGR